MKTYFISLLLLLTSFNLLSDDYTPLLDLTSSIHKDDWDAIQKRGSLRVLVTPNRTNFFVAKEKGRGFELEMFRHLEENINKLRKSKKLTPFRITFVPVSHDQLLPSLNKGLGDVAAAMLTITPERLKSVDFTSPYITNINEVLVQSRKAKPIKSLQQLSGQTVVIASGTSYHQSLRDFNQKLAQAKLKPIRIISFPNITSEDILEMVHNDLFDYTFVDKHLAEIWSSVLTNLVIDTGIQSAQKGSIAWAVRKNNPQLKKYLSSFSQENKKGSLMGNIFFKRYYQNKSWIQQPLSSTSSRIEKYRPMFESAARQYDFDWLMLAMQAFQESRLNPNTVSHAGAVGIMQLLPATAKDMGLTNLKNPHGNIMAGAKYMDWIRTHYFNDAGITKENKTYFCLAAYNAGFGRVIQWRKAAKIAGLNPYVWFGHVEKMALKKTGYEPVHYVGNITKAYAALKQAGQQIERSEEQLKKIKKL